MKKVNPFACIYGIMMPVLCVLIDILLTRMNHGMYGLVFYAFGAFIWYQVWFNINNLINVLNS